MCMGNCLNCFEDELKNIESKFVDKKFENTKKFDFNDKKFFAKVVDIYDGDTITCIMNIFGEYYKFKIRLSGIDTCEMTTNNKQLKKKAIQAKNRLFNLITQLNINIDEEITKKDMREKLNNGNYIVLLHCENFDKYGRILAQVYNKKMNSTPSTSYNNILINEKLAYIYTGETKLSEKEQIKNLLS